MPYPIPRKQMRQRQRRTQNQSRDDNFRKSPRHPPKHHPVPYAVFHRDQHAIPSEEYHLLPAEDVGVGTSIIISEHYVIHEFVYDARDGECSEDRRGFGRGVTPRGFVNAVLETPVDEGVPSSSPEFGGGCRFEHWVEDYFVGFVAVEEVVDEADSDGALG